MEPTLNIGDVVIVKNDEIKINDVISFRENMSVVTHRVVDIQKLDGEIKYQTKGDNNNSPDTSFVSKKNVEGKVVYKIEKIGKILLILQKKEVIILAIIAYYVYLIKRSKGVRKDEKV